MACPRPWFHVDDKSTGKGHFVPCGHCLACRIDRRNEWTWRILAACRDKKAVFVTLTINNDNLIPRPVYDKEHDRHFLGSLYVKSVQDFFKRLRVNISRSSYENKSIKYYVCGEYGERDFRPHYHAIIIGLSCGKPLSCDEGDIPLIRKSWPFGFIECKPASKGSIRYVLKYLDKELADKSYYSSLGLQPPFHTSSKGMGADWILENQDSLRESNGTFFFDGAWRPIPRYYKEKIFTRDELAAMSYETQMDSGMLLCGLGFKHANPSKVRAVNDFIRSHPGTSVDQAVYALGSQELVDLKAKMNVFGKSIKNCYK